MVFNATGQRGRILSLLITAMGALCLIGCGKSGSNETSSGTGQLTSPAALVANPRATFSATPNPVTVSDGTKLGVTKLTWSTTAAKFVEIHVGRPDGTLLCQGFSSGECETGKWVTDGMIFYLQGSLGNVTDPSSTLAAVAVQVN